MDDEVKARMEEFTTDYVNTTAGPEVITEVAQETEAIPQPTDLYDTTSRANRQLKGRSSYGARPYVRSVLKQLEASPVKQAYQKARADIKYLESAGDKQRADIVRQQYMEDYYMPAVDAAVRLSSKQDVLGSKEILDTLDGLVILDGIRGQGYTASLVANLYEEGEAPTISDVEVEDAVRNIVRHCNNGDIGVAIGLAKRIKEQIDSGNNVAIPEDYELIQKVAIRGEQYGQIR